MPRAQPTKRDLQSEAKQVLVRRTARTVFFKSRDAKSVNVDLSDAIFRDENDVFRFLSIFRRAEIRRIGRCAAASFASLASSDESAAGMRVVGTRLAYVLDRWLLA